MKNKLILKLTIIVITTIGLFSNCTDNPIPYDLSNSDLKVDTLTIDLIDGVTYSSPPLMGSTKGLYFGSSEGIINQFSLIEISILSTSNSVLTYNLLDSNVVIDSLVINFTSLDSSIMSNTEFELYYFPEGGDSIFTEDESNYTNISEANVANGMLIGSSYLIQADPDSDEVVFPTLSFKIDDFENVLDFIADTTENQNRTFMLKNVDPIDGIVSFASKESPYYPVLDAYYRVEEDTLHSIFFSTDDITIVEPRELLADDRDYITLSRAAGLKSIVEINIDELPQDSITMVIRSAELVFPTTTTDSIPDFEVKAAFLENPFNVDEFFELPEDEYTVVADELLSGAISNSNMKMELREYLQGIITGSYDNNGLKMYTASSSDPFRTVHFLNNPNISNEHPFIRITYVKF